MDREPRGRERKGQRTGQGVRTAAGGRGTRFWGVSGARRDTCAAEQSGACRRSGSLCPALAPELSSSSTPTSAPDHEPRELWGDQGTAAWGSGCPSSRFLSATEAPSERARGLLRGRDQRVPQNKASHGCSGSSQSLEHSPEPPAATGNGQFLHRLIPSCPGMGLLDILFDRPQMALSCHVSFFGEREGEPRE